MNEFVRLKRALDYTRDPNEREILLDGIARVGNFPQLKHVLDHTSDPDERKVLLEAMTRHPNELKKATKQITRKRFDVFIAHASEDKGFVTPLALSLKQRGLRVWYDDFILKVGDSLRREIDKGLAESRYGVVILSHNFFAKHWPQKELDGLAAKEQLGKKVILPVWHNIDKEEVASYSPTLADIVAVKSSIGIEAVANKIIAAISS